MLGSLRRARKLQRVELEVGDRTQCDGDRNLERGGRRQPSADRQGRVNRSLDADGRAPEVGELRLDGGGVPSPVGVVTGALGTRPR